MNFNLPDKKYPQETVMSLFPSAITPEDIERQIQQAPMAIQKILNYYLLTDFENKYEEAYFFLQHYYENSKIPVEKINDPIVYKVIKTVRRIQRQIHKLMGLLRFREIEGGYLYAPFSSDFDIIVPLSIHFAHRFPDEQIIIHDTKRRKALFVEKEKIYKVTFYDIIPPETNDEILFQQLWKKYYQGISIDQRENKKLQRQNLPLKFQVWLTEFGEPTSYKKLK